MTSRLVNQNGRSSGSSESIKVVGVAEVSLKLRLAQLKGWVDPSSSKNHSEDKTRNGTITNRGLDSTITYII